MLNAITRQVGPNLVNCELTYIDRGIVNIPKAITQHHAYTATLETLGINVVSLPPLPPQPDGVFVEDTAVVLDEVAIISRLGAKSRQGEQTDVASVLQGFRHLKRLQPPALLDGGDVMRIDKMLYVGLSSRTNREAVRQLIKIVGEYGYTVRTVPTKKSLHLKTACSYLGNNTILINPKWVDKKYFRDLRLFTIDNDEPWGANALLINETVLYPTRFPSTLKRIQKIVSVKTVDISELQKAEAGLTCMSIVFKT